MTRQGSSSQTVAQHEGRSDLALHSAEIVDAVKSLYADDLKPWGRVLLRRLRERAAARRAEEQGLSIDEVDPETMPRVDPKNLRKLCAANRQLLLQREEGKEYSVTLRGQRYQFLDVCSGVDDYPREMWEDFAAYLDSLDESEVALPGGRYVCTQLLMRRKLPFLQGLSIGRVCHIVQLAITQRRLLGYKAGALAPWKRSDGYMREVCASTQSPTGLASLPAVSSWATLREYLQQLLAIPAAMGAPNSISMSNLKRLFRDNFNVELSETALGHVRLLSLLQDPRLSDICSLHLQEPGQLVLSGVQGQQPYLLGPVYPVSAWGAAVPMLVWAQPAPRAEPEADRGGLLPAGAAPGRTPPSSGTACAMSPCTPPRGDMMDACDAPRHLAWDPEESYEPGHTGTQSQELGEKQSSGGSTTDCAEWHASASVSASDNEETEVTHSPINSVWPVSVKNTFINVAVEEATQMTRSRQRRMTWGGSPPGTLSAFQ